MVLRSIFFPAQTPTTQELKGSGKVLIIEGALASILMALGTGNFLAGYLSYLGASASFCAIVGALPQLGCVMQFLAPLVFERLHHRKLLIWLLCFVFRLSLGFSVLAPLLFPQQSRQLGYIFVLYFLAFLAAGFVTPGLNQMILDIAPQEQRGRFFALKDIVAVAANSLVALLMGKQLDYFISRGEHYTGFLLVGGLSVALAFADAAVLSRVREKPSEHAARLHLKDLMVPFRDKGFHSIIVYMICWSVSVNFAAPFLFVHLLRDLKLSHTFITSIGVVSCVAGMVGGWVWGKVADRTYWDTVVKATALVTVCCSIGWFFVAREGAPFFAPIILAATAACAGASGAATLNLQYVHCPPKGKTTYLGVTAAVASVLGWLAAMLGTVVQTMLEGTLGDRSIPTLYLVAGSLSGLSLLYSLRKLPGRPKEPETE